MKSHTVVNSIQRMKRLEQICGKIFTRMESSPTKNVRIVIDKLNFFLNVCFHASFYSHLVNEQQANEIKSKMAIAVCVNIKVKPFSKGNIEFSLVWNMPNIYFSAEPDKIYKR